MELINLKVNHKILGKGIVIETSDNYITIEFSSKISKFVYPYSFEKFLTAEDDEVQSEILEKINIEKQIDNE